MARALKKLSPEQEAKNYDEAGKIERFQQRRAWFNLEWSRQEQNRYQMALDEDYYDSIQYTPEEAAEIRGRGQNPVVYNEIKPTCDFMIGTERRMRRDFKVLARNNKAKEAADDAQVKTNLLKYLDDANRSPFERSQAFDDAVKAGLGFLEVAINPDPDAEPIVVRAESWRHCLHDSVSGERKPDRWRYFFRFKEIDTDIAHGYFPEHKQALDRASNAGLEGENDSAWTGIFPTMGLIGNANMPAKYTNFDTDAWLNNPRKRVLLIECWCYMPKPGGGMKMTVSIMTKYETILEADSPYKHNKFPFIPVWCYRRKRDGLPYGIVRPVRGPQDDLNKRMSKSVFLMSINQIRVEKSAIDREVMDEDQLREQLADPMGVAVFADGALSGGKVQVRDQIDLAQGHVMLAEIDRQTIRGTSSVNEENRGLKSSATSRVAMDAKADRGSVGTAEVFDNLLFAHQLEGELCLSLIEQFYTEEKTFSVTGERFKLDYYTINETDPSGQRLNDVTRHKATFVIGDAPWRQALGEAAFESALAMLGQLAPVAPQVVVSIIDLVFEWSDMPNKQAILQRIRQATGMSDPDEGDTPEQQLAKSQQKQMAAAQFNAQMAQLQADIKEAQAKGAKLEAEAMAKRLEALYMSAQGAQVLLQAPGAMPIADELLKSAGFKDASGGPTLDQAVMPEQPAQPQLPPPQGGPADVPPELQQADGAMTGIETPRADGVLNPEGAM